MAKTSKNKRLHVHRGRPFKEDKDEWTQVTCMLRIETLERLRAGAGSLRFGNFLQDHLDRHPPPTREQYLQLSTPYAKINVGEPREDRQAAREQARRDRLTPEERAKEDALSASLAKIVEETYSEKIQMHAIQSWAEQHGRTWKEALRRAWTTGIYPKEADKETLIQIRDQKGTGWLAKLKLEEHAIA